MEAAPTPHPRIDSPSRLSPFQRTLVVLLLGTAVVVLAHRVGANFSSWSGLQGSGVTATQTRTVPSFSEIDLAGASAINVQVGDVQTVVVHADDNLIERVTTEVRDGTLVVEETGRFSTSSPLTVDVTVPTLAAVTLSGSGHVRVAGVRAGDFTVRVSGSGQMIVAGQVERLDASLPGSGNVLLRGLTARDVTATVAGSGHLEVWASMSLDASIPGSGEIVYAGHPATVRQSISGSGAVVEG